MRLWYGPAGDPVRDAEYHDRECRRRLALRPRCGICGEPIWENRCFAGPVCRDCGGDGEKPTLTDLYIFDE